MTSRLCCTTYVNSAERDVTTICNTARTSVNIQIMDFHLFAFEYAHLKAHAYSTADSDR